MEENREFCEQLAAGLVKLGTKEALSCMARMMAAIAHKAGNDLEFDCDLGVVTIERKAIKTND